MMEKSIGIVICNYNKKEYIVNCIQSVLSSSISGFDIYVVDNASTDDSVSCIQKEFGNKISLIVNNENLGGSGGFNTGLRAALEKNYKYIMLLDNDIVVDSKAVEELYLFLEQNPEVGMVGSKVYFMDYPNQIWGYGGHIDFTEYIQKDHYKNMVDSEMIPEVDYCDYVAACSLMARTDAIREVGLLPEDNFIYWDDMEWGHRFNRHGYKVAVYGKSKIWHKAGGRNAESTFIHYYMWRNRINFFISALDNAEEKESFIDKILDEMFRMIYSVNLKGETNIVKTLMYALDDVTHGVRGKAEEYKILRRFPVNNRVKEYLHGKRDVLLKFTGEYEALSNIIRNIRSFDSKINIVVSIEDDFSYSLVKDQLNQQPQDIQIIKEYTPEDYSCHLVMCKHIFNLPANSEQDYFIDSWNNIIGSIDDYNYCNGFEQARQLFLLYKKCLFSKFLL